MDTDQRDMQSREQGVYSLTSAAAIELITSVESFLIGFGPFGSYSAISAVLSDLASTSSTSIACYKRELLEKIDRRGTGDQETAMSVGRKAI